MIPKAKCATLHWTWCV